MTIEEDVRKLAVLRRKKAEIDEEIKVSREAWMEENAGKILAASVAGDLVVEMEEKIRAAAIAIFQETGNKKPAPGVGIRKVKTVEYDTRAAVAFAFASAPALLRLDEKAFEANMKATPEEYLPDFVTVVEIPQATIARTLEEI